MVCLYQKRLNQTPDIAVYRFRYFFQGPGTLGKNTAVPVRDDDINDVFLFYQIIDMLI